MSQQIDIGGIVNNDLVFSFQLLSNNAPVNLGSYVPRIVVKASKLVADSTGVTYAVNSGLVIVSAPLGKLTFTIPAAATATAGSTWYRCDVLANSQSFTVCFGNLVYLSA
jgi:hypothetical protein